MTNRPPGPPGPPPVPGRPAGPAAPARPAGPPAARAPQHAAPPPAGPQPGRPGVPPHKSKAALIGWIVSGMILVAVVVGALFIFGVLDFSRYPLGEPTKETTAAGKLDAIAIDFDMAAIVDPPPSGAGAEQMYKDLLKATHPLTVMYKPGDKVPHERLYPVYDDIARWNPKYQPILDILVKAADTGYDEAYDLLYPEADLPMSFQNEFAAEALFKAWGNVAQYAALQAQKDKRDADAVKYWRAMLIYGQRLWKHGVYVGARTAGLKTMRAAIAGLQAYYLEKKDEAKIKAIAEIDKATQAQGVKWVQKLEGVIGPLPRSAGDLWNVAENDKDRSWRLAGVMWLGYMKAERNTSEDAVNKYLDKKAASEKDSLIQDKAKQARQLKISEINIVPVPGKG